MDRSQGIWRWIQLLAIASVVCALDRVTKSWATTSLEYGHSARPLRFLDFRYWENTGIVFGTFEGAGIYLAPFSILAIGFLIYFYRDIPEKDPLSSWGISLVLGGAVGNLIDRFSLGYVVDFIYLRIWPFPFNIADCGVTVGLFLVLAGSFFYTKDTDASNPD